MSNKTVEEFISQFPEPIQVITNSLRQIVLNSSDELKEELKWGMPSYSVNKNICYLQPSKKHVNLGFYEGGQLDRYKQSIRWRRKKNAPYPSKEYSRH